MSLLDWSHNLGYITVTWHLLQRVSFHSSSIEPLSTVGSQLDSWWFPQKATFWFQQKKHRSDSNLLAFTSTLALCGLNDREWLRVCCGITGLSVQLRGLFVTFNEDVFNKQSMAKSVRTCKPMLICACCIYNFKTIDLCFLNSFHLFLIDNEVRHWCLGGGFACFSSLGFSGFCSPFNLLSLNCFM